MRGVLRQSISVKQAAALAGVVVAPWLAAAQTQPVNVPAAVAPRRIEQGTEDVNPLAASPRIQAIDMRAPTGFDTVYTFEEADPMSRNGGYFFRVSGGITAVFPRSVYMTSGRGMTPALPAGTVFYIGGLPPELLPPPAPEQQGETPYNALDFSAPVDEASTATSSGGEGWLVRRPPTAANTAVNGALESLTLPGRQAPTAAPAEPAAPASGDACAARPVRRALPIDLSVGREAEVAPQQTKRSVMLPAFPVSIWTSENYRAHSVAALLKAAAAATPDTEHARTKGAPAPTASEASVPEK